MTNQMKPVRNNLSIARLEKGRIDVSSLTVIENIADATEDLRSSCDSSLNVSMLGPMGNHSHIFNTSGGPPSGINPIDFT